MRYDFRLDFGDIHFTRELQFLLRKNICILLVTFNEARTGQADFFGTIDPLNGTRYVDLLVSSVQ
jgi:hypothetical protein